jgi:hypothetical protein
MMKKCVRKSNNKVNASTYIGTPIDILQKEINDLDDLVSKHHHFQIRDTNNEIEINLQNEKIPYVMENYSTKLQYSVLDKPNKATQTDECKYAGCIMLERAKMEEEEMRCAYENMLVFKQKMQCIENAVDRWNLID